MFEVKLLLQVEGRAVTLTMAEAQELYKTLSKLFCASQLRHEPTFKEPEVPRR